MTFFEKRGSVSPGGTSPKALWEVRALLRCYPPQELVVRLARRFGKAPVLMSRGVAVGPAAARGLLAATEVHGAVEVD